jgi:hypothetical protein
MMPKTSPSWKAFFMHVEEVGRRNAKMEMRGSETNRFSARVIALLHVVHGACHPLICLTRKRGVK